MYLKPLIKIFSIGKSTPAGDFHIVQPRINKKLLCFLNTFVHHVIFRRNVESFFPFPVK